MNYHSCCNASLVGWHYNSYDKELCFISHLLCNRKPLFMFVTIGFTTLLAFVFFKYPWLDATHPMQQYFITGASQFLFICSCASMLSQLTESQSVKYILVQYTVPLEMLFGSIQSLTFEVSHKRALNVNCCLTSNGVIVFLRTENVLPVQFPFLGLENVWLISIERTEQSATVLINRRSRSIYVGHWTTLQRGSPS